MYIQFSCTGGIANLSLMFECEIQELPDEKAEKLLDLLKESKMLEMKSMTKANVSRTGADAFTYLVKIENGMEKLAFSCTDLTAPKEVRPLLEYLRNMAIAVKMDP
ncbi:hypothetical protein L1999_14780 [Neobacillus drentensis]|uniref:protealysin inhibitor emfourin n=1 Tax=Neobacillus drentensis TaxID=220684 RepID=UPI001F239B58|nr:protealysin inhibitor emfourin [Neobacillus drentensis]ULT54439.1 hypothetical protein L1999_14780 [Neobacillus drentensis]